MDTEVEPHRPLRSDQSFEARYIHVRKLYFEFSQNHMDLLPSFKEVDERWKVSEGYLRGKKDVFCVREPGSLLFGKGR